jgi:hypothetical protein
MEAQDLHLSAGRPPAMPEIISGPQVLQAWPLWERIALRAAGIQDVLWLHQKKEQAGGPEPVEARDTAR